MCHFLTGCVSKRADLAELNAFLGEAGLSRRFRFIELKNPHVIPQLPPFALYCSMRHSHCDCGTAIGGAVRGGASSPPGKAKLKKLRAKGWSETRIERWKREREAAVGRKHQSSFANQGEERDLWWSFITAVLESNLTRHLGLLKHWYSSDVFKEDFPFSTHQLTIQNREADYLADLSEDVLYVFEKGNA